MSRMILSFSGHAFVDERIGFDRNQREAADLDLPDAGQDDRIGRSERVGAGPGGCAHLRPPRLQLRHLRLRPLPAGTDDWGRGRLLPRPTGPCRQEALSAAGEGCCPVPKRVLPGLGGVLCRL
uniref:Uncharacterized protein n=1 Tax=Panagrolaimus sp. JU765 TaxID=591449 RepID=A0AC34Q819_9BILA